MSPVVAVFLYGLVTAIATALGVVPYFFVRRISRRVVAASNAIASGLMLGACFGLVSEGTDLGALQTGLGGLLGVAFIMATQKLLDGQDIGFGNARGADAPAHGAHRHRHDRALDRRGCGDRRLVSPAA